MKSDHCLIGATNLFRYLNTFKIELGEPTICFNLLTKALKSYYSWTTQMASLIQLAQLYRKKLCVCIAWHNVVLLQDGFHCYKYLLVLLLFVIIYGIPRIPAGKDYTLSHCHFLNFKVWLHKYLSWDYRNRSSESWSLLNYSSIRIKKQHQQKN